MGGPVPEPYRAAESLGTTKVGDFFGFLNRNRSAREIMLRFRNWHHRVGTRYGMRANRPGVRFPLMGIFVMCAINSYEGAYPWYEHHKS